MKKQMSSSHVIVTNSNLPQLVSDHPELIEILRKNFLAKISLGTGLVLIGIPCFFVSLVLGIVCFGIAIYAFYKSYKFHLAYQDAKRIYWDENMNLSNQHNKGQCITTASNDKSVSSQQLLTYKTYHRPRDGFVDNMNYRLYRCRAVYLKTNRQRTMKIEAFDEEDVKMQLQNSGFIEPFKIERIPFPEYSDAQKALLGNICLRDVCLYDASAIIRRRDENDSAPNPELIAYATELHLKFSYYIGKKSLYGLIFNLLDLEDKIAFFIFCIYRYKTNDRQGNLNHHPYHDLFYDFARENISNESFIKSMNKYSGSELRYFGNYTVDGSTFHGGSTNTIAYKSAISFLKQHFQDKLK